MIRLCGKKSSSWSRSEGGGDRCMSTTVYYLPSGDKNGIGYMGARRARVSAQSRILYRHALEAFPGTGGVRCQVTKSKAEAIPYRKGQWSRGQQLYGHYFLFVPYKDSWHEQGVLLLWISWAVMLIDSHSLRREMFWLLINGRMSSLWFSNHPTTNEPIHFDI